MFIQWQNLVQLEEERRRDLQREFERQRLVQEVLAGRKREPALAWLGERLVAWGEKLQEQANGRALPPVRERQA